MDCSTPGFPVLYYLPEFAQTHVHWVSDAVQPSHPRYPTSPPALNLSQHQGLKYWSVSFSISPSNEYSGLISFRIDSFDLLAVQGTFKSLLQHHNLKALLSWCFLMAQLSHPRMTIGKTIALTIWTFVSKVMSLLFNTLARFIIAFLPRSKNLNFMAAALVHSDFGAQENSLSLFPLFPFYLPWSDGTRCHDLSFLDVELQASFFTLFYPHQEAF